MSTLSANVSSLWTQARAHSGLQSTKYVIVLCGRYRMIRRNHLTTNATCRTLWGTTSSVRANRKTCTCSSNRTRNENCVFFTFGDYLRHFWVRPRVDGRPWGYLAGTRVEIAAPRPFWLGILRVSSVLSRIWGDNLQIRTRSFPYIFIIH